MKTPPRILLIGYPFLNTQNGDFADLFKGADEKSRQFPILCAKLAKEYDCAYLDMSSKITMSKEDGLHFDKVAHAKVSKIIAEKILSEESKILDQI